FVVEQDDLRVRLAREVDAIEPFGRAPERAEVLRVGRILRGRALERPERLAIGSEIEERGAREPLAVRVGRVGRKRPARELERTLAVAEAGRYFAHSAREA